MAFIRGVVYCLFVCLFFQTIEAVIFNGRMHDCNVIKSIALPVRSTERGSENWPKPWNVRQ